MTIKHAAIYERGPSDIFGNEVKEADLQDLAENINGLTEIATGTDAEGNPGTGHDHGANGGPYIPHLETTSGLMVAPFATGVETHLVIAPTTQITDATLGVFNTYNNGQIYEQDANAIPLHFNSDPSTASIIEIDGNSYAATTAGTTYHPSFFTLEGDAGPPAWGQYKYLCARRAFQGSTKSYIYLFTPLESDPPASFDGDCMVWDVIYLDGRGTPIDYTKWMELYVPDWATRLVIDLPAKGTIEKWLDVQPTTPDATVPTEGVATSQTTGVPLFDIYLKEEVSGDEGAKVEIVSEKDRRNPTYRRLELDVQDFQGAWTKFAVICDFRGESTVGEEGQDCYIWHHDYLSTKDGELPYLPTVNIAFMRV